MEIQQGNTKSLGIVTVTAIALVAHIGDIKRFRNADKLAKFSGMAPVNFSSAGKGKDSVTEKGMDKSKAWDMGHNPGLEFRKHQQSAN